MDPTACFNNWDNAVCDGEVVDARLAALDLLNWLSSGGFEPKWYPGQKSGFYNWCSDQGFNVPGVS